MTETEIVRLMGTGMYSSGLDSELAAKYEGCGPGWTRADCARAVRNDLEGLLHVGVRISMFYLGMLGGEEQVKYIVFKTSISLFYSNFLLEK